MDWGAKYGTAMDWGVFQDSHELVHNRPVPAKDPISCRCQLKQMQTTG